MTTSGPPRASSWAAPPEFYLDENVVTKSLRRRLIDLGYVVHTPAELFGSRDESNGRADADWLARVGEEGWAAISRDHKIHERPQEIAAYREAGIHMFLLPGKATATELTALVETNLRAICAATSKRRPGIWKITTSGMRPYP
ncbi:MAG: hypothetical protein U0990_07030 [Candidatus Nanopelagicales bacterium]|nr:hypothetical protein [Candidatus Nanopelagicales bacterium]MDZ4249830.1 hypothetical protein [Candidatus Nanopelagicales bacterium]